jgi:hypothetical protein
VYIIEQNELFNSGFDRLYAFPNACVEDRDDFAVVDRVSCDHLNRWPDVSARVANVGHTATGRAILDSHVCHALVNHRDGTTVPSSLRRAYIQGWDEIELRFPPPVRRTTIVQEMQ